jgi:hypothetical protein
MQAIEMTLEQEARLLNEKAKMQMPEDERRGLVSWQGSAGCSRRGCDKEGREEQSIAAGGAASSRSLFLIAHQQKTCSRCSLHTGQLASEL